MTQFKVSDEALKVALSSIVLEGEDVLHSIVFGLNNDDETIRRLMAEEIVRAAIEAALPVMFERVAFVNPVLLNAVTEHNFLDKVNHKVRLRYEPKNSLEIPLYRIKEPK